jgi:hypothetical protein
VAEERRQGEQSLERALVALERALVALERRSATLRQRLRVYEEGCRGRFNVMGCPGLKQEIEGLLREIGAGLQAAEDSARRAWVYPGTVREIRQRHGLDAESWSELTKGLREALQ